jgi:hypothetical protein
MQLRSLLRISFYDTLCRLSCNLFSYPSSLPYIHSVTMVIICTSKASSIRLSARRSLGYVTKKAGKIILEDDRKVTYYSQFKVLRELMGINS